MTAASAGSTLFGFDCCNLSVGLCSLWAAIFLGKFLYFQWLLPLHKYFGMTKDLRELAGTDWAVITGASEGIGRAYAKQLAKRGFNLVLISRSKEKLTAAAKEIKELISDDVQIRILPFDFSTARMEDYDWLENELDDIDIGFLLNNVGVSSGTISRLGDVRNEKLRDIIVVNCLATTLMTKLALAQMTKRNKGVIVNMSSGTCFRPTPLLTTYAATKTYIRQMTESIQTEYSDTDIVIQTQTPFFVCTKMSGIREPSWVTPSADDYAERAIECIGYCRVAAGWWAHALELSICRFLPHWFTNILTYKILDYVKNKWSRKSSNDQNGTTMIKTNSRAYFSNGMEEEPMRTTGQSSNKSATTPPQMANGLNGMITKGNGTMMTNGNGMVTNGNGMMTNGLNGNGILYEKNIKLRFQNGVHLKEG